MLRLPLDLSLASWAGFWSVLTGSLEAISATLLGMIIDGVAETSPENFATDLAPLFAIFALYYLVLRPIIFGMNTAAASIRLEPNLFPLILFFIAYKLGDIYAATGVAIAASVALAFMGTRTERWPQEQRSAMAMCFRYLGFKATGEWKEEIVFFDPDKLPAGGRAAARPSRGRARCG